jgi:hypothetical protein
MTRRPRLEAALQWTALPVIGAATIAAGVISTADYGGGVVIGDDPVPALSALAHGQLLAAAHSQPLMSLTSILLRLPFVVLGSLLGVGKLASYRLGVFACGLVAGAVAVAVVELARSRGRSGVTAALIAALIVINPVTIGFELAGHPEELLGGALCLAAVLAAISDRPLLAGAMLGLAIGTKQWAVLAAVPTVLACRRRRPAMLLVAGGLAAPLVLLLPVLDPSAFARASRQIGELHFVSFESWWWPFHHDHNLSAKISGVVPTLTRYTLPFGLSRSQIAWLPLAAAAAIGWRYRRIGADRDPANAIGVLALLMLLRCTLDPELTTNYYLLPALMALLAWEALTRPTSPLGSLLMLALLLANQHFRLHFLAHPPPAALAIAPSVALALYLAVATLAPVLGRTASDPKSAAWTRHLGSGVTVRRAPP